MNETVELLRDNLSYLAGRESISDSSGSEGKSCYPHAAVGVSSDEYLVGWG